MRSLVTGASGFVGSYLVRRLLAANAEVFVVVRPESNLWRIADVLKRVTVLHADLSDMKSAEAAILAAKANVVFHTAWQGVTGSHRNEESQILHNVPGSLILFQQAQAAGCKCWVGLGSQAEYGRVNGVLSEDRVPQPETAYGVAKLAVQTLTEKLCALAGMRFLWFRLLTAYGPMDDPHHLIVPLIQDLLQGIKPALTAGEQQWDYLYIEDAAEAIVRAAGTPNVQGVFNLGSGHAQTIRSVVETIRDAIDTSLPLGFGEIKYRPDQVMHLQADITKLTAATGWKPQVGLEEGLHRTVDWYVRSATQA